MIATRLPGSVHLGRQSFARVTPTLASKAPLGSRRGRLREVSCTKPCTRALELLAGSEENAHVSAHVIYLVGGAPRVGKSSLAQRLLVSDGIPWLPTDVIRTVVRRVVPEVDAVDQDPVDAVAFAEVMYPHIEQAAEVCAEEADRFLIEGFELAPSYPARLRAALAGSEIRACFLGHRSFSAEDLAAYRGPKPQSEGDLSPGELRESASWIRHRSRELAEQCTALRVPYVDVGQVGFSAAMAEARRLLLGPS